MITITITGTGDASVISGTVTGAVTEGDVGDPPVTATGTITISDVDDDDNPFFPNVASTPGDNAFGDFVLTSGTWTYTLNQAAVQNLDALDVVTDTITFTASDLSTQVITITITGTDEGVVILPPDPGPPPGPGPLPSPDPIDEPVDDGDSDPGPTSLPPEGEPPTDGKDGPSGELDPEELALRQVPNDPADDEPSASIDLTVPSDRDTRSAQGAARADYLRVIEFPTQKLSENPDVAEIELTQTDVDRLRDDPDLSESVFRALDMMRVDMDESFSETQAHQTLLLQVARGAGVSLSAGYLTWLLRAGSLLSGLMSAMPLWARVDPLPIIDLDEKERKLRQQRASQSSVDDDETEANVERLLSGDKPFSNRTSGSPADDA